MQRLRDAWDGPIVLKGVVSADDAVEAKSRGFEAVWVSNHAGRQLDAAPASIVMLPAIRAAVGDAYPLLFDSGIRNGEDVVKALALGADFVMLGRPALFALGAAGRAGLDALMTCFAQDIDLALAQIGARQISDISQDTLFSPDAVTAQPDTPSRPMPLAAST